MKTFDDQRLHKKKWRHGRPAPFQSLSVCFCIPEKRAVKMFSEKEVSGNRKHKADDSDGPSDD